MSKYNWEERKEEIRRRLEVAGKKMKCIRAEVEEKEQNLI